MQDWARLQFKLSRQSHSKQRFGYAGAHHFSITWDGLVGKAYPDIPFTLLKTSVTLLMIVPTSQNHNITQHQNQVSLKASIVLFYRSTIRPPYQRAGPNIAKSHEKTIQIENQRIAYFLAPAYFQVSVLFLFCRIGINCLNSGLGDLPAHLLVLDDTFYHTNCHSR